MRHTPDLCSAISPDAPLARMTCGVVDCWLDWMSLVGGAQGRVAMRGARDMADLWKGRVARLRAVEPEDWETHHHWDQDTEMSRRIDFMWPPTSRERARQWAEETSKRMPDDDNFAFEIEALDGGALVGHIGVHDCDRRVGAFSYGLAVLPQHQRRGYASEAILLVARYFFQELRYQKMNAQVHSDNTPSLALHEKLGFMREGALRQMVYTGGQFYDLVQFGMTREEFAERYPAMARA